MGKGRIKRPRGTRDFGPKEMVARRSVENILRQAAETYGYREIATPAFEHLELFTMKSGEEIVAQLYTFQDKGQRTMALRPELTAAALRFFVEDMVFEPKPVKVYYIGNCFRYERPQKGRFREFWQFGAETIGSSSPEAAAEIISLANYGIKETGLQDYVLRVGHLKILKGILEMLGANQKAVMTLIDKGNMDGLHEYFQEFGIQGFDLLRSILDLSGDVDAIDIAKGLREWPDGVMQGFETLGIISNMLSDAGIQHEVDFGIARGLDYYTGMVFEIDVPSLGAEKQICGGGEYDLNDIFSLDLKGTSGFAIGFDRLLMALEQEKRKFQAHNPYVGVVPTPNTESTAFAIATRLRDNGISTELEVMGRGLKKALSRMNELAVKYTIITGERELDTGNVVIRNMITGKQEEIPMDAVIAHMKRSMKENGP